MDEVWKAAIEDAIEKSKKLVINGSFICIICNIKFTFDTFSYLWTIQIF